MKRTISFLLVFTWIACVQTNVNNYKKMEGVALGTTFHITYKDSLNQINENQIDSLIHSVNGSMSTYLANSDISKINSGDSSVIVDAMFQEVFIKSKRIYSETKGYFDPTIGILVNAWGFGPEGEIDNLDTIQVKRMLEFVGFDKVQLKNNKIVKLYSKIYIDFNAIAKGYAVDVIGRFLESKGIINYLVEIGGEIRAKGINQSNKSWTISIEKPNFDGTRSFQTKIKLKNQAIATSGNYRKFKIDSKTGEKYAHTIDTKTGFPSKRNLLSVSVISELDCADVDAYATAFMAMGLKKSKLFLKKHPELTVFLIFSDDKGEIKTYASKQLMELK